MGKPKGDVVRLLDSIAQGDGDAAEALFPLVYEELHRLATNFMRRERKDHTLQATALIHEAFLRLTDTPQASSEAKDYANLDHFVATASVVMRRVLVNHAKAKKTSKRGGGERPLQLDNVAESFEKKAIDLVALDDAMISLAEIDSTQHRLVELRFFGGLTIPQCAQQLGISERTAYYEWAHARAWLRIQIEQT